MSRPKNKIKNIKLNTSIPEDLRNQLDKYLKKIHGGVIQVGAYQKFIVARIREFLSKEE